MDGIELFVPKALCNLLNRHHLSQSVKALPMDASRRCYYRLIGSNGNRSLPLVMECPESEKPQQFVLIAHYLRKMGLRAPNILDHEGDFFLIEDFGKGTYRYHVTGAQYDEKKHYALYTLAVDVLIEIIQKATIKPQFLPTYTMDVFLQEARVFTEWVLGWENDHHPGAKEYQSLWMQLLSDMHLPHTFVHRDFHIDNLFYLEDEGSLANGVSLNACGLIDFQDGLWGPIGYDFVSFINDARIDVPEALRQHLINRYLSCFPMDRRDQMLRQFSIMDMHRQLRIVGVFHRLRKRDGKTHYEQYLPRVWGYIQRNIQDPWFYDLKKWLMAHGFLETF